MKTAKLVTTGGSQAVRLPREFRFDGDEVSIRREGRAVVLEPIAKRKWPRGFIEMLRKGDSGIKRPPQGKMPPVPDFDA